MKLFNILVLGLIYGASAQSADWYLAPTGTPTASVGGTNTSVIDLTYEMANHSPAVRVYKDDCTTTATAVTAQLKTPLQSKDQRTSRSLTQGMIQLCVRVDLLDSTGTSYNFKEQKLYVTVDLTQGFTIAAVDVDRTAAGVDNTNANTEFGLNVCQCNASSICTTSTLVQGDAAFVCITTTAGSGVQIASIQQLNYTQAGVITIPAIANGVGNGLTDVTNQGTSARIQSQLPSVLLDPANIGIPLVGNGVVVVRFGTGRARKLRFTIGNNAVDQTGGASASRLMQEQGTESQTGFSVRMALASSPSEAQAPTEAQPNTGALIGGIVGAIAGVAIIVALVLAARRRKKDDDEQEQAKSGGRSGMVA
ncbi:hypothetical protein MHU86_15076 [Fragilaria crotonensis]|nr:hypothetical protein MHU86_15076 [Fragilaria crotonensis]